MTDIEIKNRLVTTDRRLDRVPLYDERSRGFQVRSLLGDPPARLAMSPAPWYPAHPSLNQDPHGGCVAFSISTFLNSSPNRRKDELGFARSLEMYHAIQHEDPWDGCHLGPSCPIESGPRYDGTAVLTGVKVAKDRGLIDSYWWCGAGSGTAIDDVVDATREYGVIFGTRWLNSMFTPQRGRLIVEPDSGLAGYHAYHGLAFRYAKVPGLGMRKREHIVIQNTWGPWGADWYGVSGHAFVLVEDIEQHLLPREFYGEAVVPIQGPS